MGVLSDIIIANRNDASSINAANGQHREQWDCLESKGIDTIKLGTLSQILANKPVDDVNTVATFMMDGLVDSASDEGPWVYLVPDGLITRLASLDEDEEEAVAVKWAETEEFRLDRWQTADVEEYLRDLVAYARKARDNSKPMLLWMCL